MIYISVSDVCHKKNIECFEFKCYLKLSERTVDEDFFFFLILTFILASTTLLAVRSWKGREGGHVFNPSLRSACFYTWLER